VIAGRRRVVVALVGVIGVVATVGCGLGQRPELDDAAVRKLLAGPDGLPPSWPVLSPARGADLQSCRYFYPRSNGGTGFRREACDELDLSTTTTAALRAQLRQPLPRIVVALSPVQRPSEHVRTAAFQYEWDPASLDEDVRSCFSWRTTGAATARFTFQDGQWRLAGVDEIVYEHNAFPCVPESPAVP
jgi:hypothetical protein